MDKIIIKDLEIYAYHGVNPEENFLGQKFIVSLELLLDFRLAGKTDDLYQSTNYADVCKFVEILFVSEEFKLIEKCAETVAEKILLEFELVQSVKVHIKKPWAPIGSHLDYAGVEIKRGWHTAYLGLGSNIGDKNNNLNVAIELLNSRYKKSNQVTNVSKYYTTKPVGYLEQDDFLNCAIECKTLLTPMELMKLAMDIEKDMKRERTIKNGPRTIDIDVLLYDNIISENNEIIIPHPRMSERLFVLVPLNEIAPNKVHPIDCKRIHQLKDILFEQQNQLF